MEFIEITEDNWEAVVKLKPKDEQASYLRPDIAMHSLARSYVQRNKPDRLIPFAIQENGQLVGSFLIRSYGRGCNLTSFFIDENFQGKGLGRKALSKFIAYVQSNYPDAREIEIAIAPGNTVAEGLYQSFGFKYTGEKTNRGNLFMELHFGDG